MPLANLRLAPPAAGTVTLPGDDPAEARLGLSRENPPQGASPFVPRGSLPRPTLPTAAVPTDWREFASHLARKHSITGNPLEQLGPTQENKLRELWALTDLSASDFADEVARFFGLPRISLPQMVATSPRTALFSRRFLREGSLFPCQVKDEPCNTLVVADPTDTVAARAAELVFGTPVALRVGSFEDIATILADQLGDEETTGLEPGVSAQPQHDEDIESLRDLASGAPVVRAVNDLLEQAMEFRATDIHVEPFRKGLVLRMRVDGVLRIVPTPPDVSPQGMISRIKILAGLNIAERRLPQDGAAHLRVARSEIDIRVATMPTQGGESAVIRLLPKDRGALETAKLGLSIKGEETLKRLLMLPHGMIVVTGPTGSGKTTTLATMLTVLNDASRKILTIEDPVEYEISGVNQSQVKPEIGLTFATALRSFVRQDPDVIMVGEIRDRETAHIAIHAALTGHLVLTTLHTESAAAAVPRLLDLGVENFLLQSTLRAVIAQRLVRMLCANCKASRQLTPALLTEDPRYRMLGLQAGETVHEPRSCERCGGTGYRGRTGVFELLETTDEIRELIGARADADRITRAAAASGMTTLFRDGIAKCRSGTTSIAEVLRVTTAD